MISVQSSALSIVLVGLAVGVPVGGVLVQPPLATALDNASQVEPCHPGTASQQYWDLGFEIRNAPSWYGSCPQTPLRYEVWVTNHGTLKSPNVLFITGMVVDPGRGDWSPNAGIKHLASGFIPPGQTKKFQISHSYCGAYKTKQYLKAEMEYAGGSGDDYLDNNFDQQAIMIQ